VTGTGAAGLLVDAEVSRGSFTLSVDLAVPPGQVVGVLGPNGAGKSTLLKAVAGLTPVARGRIVLRGRVVDDAGTGKSPRPLPGRSASCSRITGSSRT
jgi:molybdate transport system ATP-binding protein